MLQRGQRGFGLIIRTHGIEPVGISLLCLDVLQAWVTTTCLGAVRKAVRCALMAALIFVASSKPYSIIQPRQKQQEARPGTATLRLVQQEAPWMMTPSPQLVVAVGR